jgi:hypothetical protein
MAFISHDCLVVQFQLSKAALSNSGCATSLVRAPASNADRAEHVVPDRTDVLPHLRPRDVEEHGFISAGDIEADARGLIASLYTPDRNGAPFLVIRR